MRHLLGSVGRGPFWAIVVGSVVAFSCAGTAFTGDESAKSDGGAGSSAGRNTSAGSSAAGSDAGPSAGHATGGTDAAGDAGAGGADSAAAGDGTVGGSSVAGSSLGGHGGAAGGAAGGGGLGSGGITGGTTLPQEGLLLWLAADHGVTNTSGAVSKWQDQSTHHSDATQVVAGARPKLSSSGRLPMIEFDGEDDALALPEGFGDFTSGLSFFAVVEMLDDAGCSAIVQLSNGAEIDDIDFGRQQSSVHYEVADASVTGPADAFAVGGRKLMGYVHTPQGDAELRLDGQFMTSQAVPLPSSVPRVASFIGRTLYQDCQPLRARIGEIVLYSRALPSSERTLVEAYLRKKWDCCGT